MRSELQFVLTAAKNLPPSQLPELLGELEQIRCTAMARLTAPAASQVEPDKLLNVNEAASRLAVSKDYLYRNHARLPFSRHMGRKLLFSSAGITAYLRQRR